MDRTNQAADSQPLFHSSSSVLAFLALPFFVLLTHHHHYCIHGPRIPRLQDESRHDIDWTGPAGLALFLAFASFFQRASFSLSLLFSFLLGGGSFQPASIFIPLYLLECRMDRIGQSSRRVDQVELIKELGFRRNSPS
eukprot:scaffold1065_cov58-Cylindrotheca_fusiformis.AAC.1